MPRLLKCAYLSNVRRWDWRSGKLLAKHAPGEDPLARPAVLLADGHAVWWSERRRGEVAICIRQDRKHLGVGWEFLGYIARYAEERGIETIESIESRQNRAAIEVERDMGFTVATDPDDPSVNTAQVLQDFLDHLSVAATLNRFPRS